MSFERGEASVKYDDREVTVARLCDVINDAGFTAVEEESKQGSNLPPNTSRGYSKDLSELRAKFNGDRDKVRLLMLLSPT